MSRKRAKFKRKSKHRKEDKSKSIPINDAQSAKEEIEAQDEPHMLDSAKCVSKKDKSCKQVHIAFLPEKYQPLVEEDVVDQPQDDNTKKKQDKYKRLRKCFQVQLQNAQSLLAGSCFSITRVHCAAHMNSVCQY
ncbi:hypothetical protein DPX16_19939 [Anabarilius grahami]|uniref:Uncharacterized protein n=1 Tax=Anabarilius grahami TaxID=495550 RepID=A0A3N0YFG4_ANAGA|nr:hypothetical protein DPX16_19939 [Anabarilius grahami]